MGLPRDALADGEQVIVEMRPHWTAIGWPLVAVPAVVATLAVLVVVAPGTPVPVALAVVGIGVLCGLWLVVRAARWASTTLALTSLRIVEQSGVLGRRGEEIRLDRVAAVSFRQSPLGVLLHTGRLVVDVGGGDQVTLDHVRRPSRLQALVSEQISRWRRSALAGDGPPVDQGAEPVLGDRTPPRGTPAMASRWPMAPGGRPGDRSDAWAHRGEVDPVTDPSTDPASPWSARAGALAQRLAVLDDLHRRGAISDDELAAQRRRLLDQL